jgi:hypothetical protein
MLTPVFVDQILEQYGRSCDDSGSRTAVTSCVTRELHLLIVLKKNEFSHLPLSDILNLFQPSQISPISVVCTSTSSQHRSLKLPHLPSPQFPNGKLLMITYNQTRFTRICCSLTLQDSSWWNSLSQMFYRQMLGVDLLYHQCLTSSIPSLLSIFLSNELRISHCMFLSIVSATAIQGTFVNRNLTNTPLHTLSLLIMFGVSINYVAAGSFRLGGLGLLV